MPTISLHQPDYMGHAGASILAAQLTAYWAQRGHKVCVWLEEIQDYHSPTSTKKTYAVRSDMIGGRPRE